MKLRRMAVVAAAAVVSPAALTATPAFAQNNPAVTVPDAAPKEDTAPAAEQVYGEAPDISLSVPPSFEPGSPQELYATLDNGDRAALPGYTPVIGISDKTGALSASHITVESRGADGRWQPAKLRPAVGQGSFEFELAAFEVPADQRHFLDVRVGFTADAPAVPLEFSIFGTADTAQGRVVSATSRYSTEIDGGEEEALVGPKLTLTGLPNAGFVAGADWHEFVMHVDNTGVESLDEYYVAMNLTRYFGQGEWLTASQIQVEAFGLDENDTEGWYPVDVEGTEDVHGMVVGVLPLDADEKTEIKLRLRFTGDTAPGPIGIHTLGWTQLESGEWMSSGTVSYQSTVTAAPAEADDDTDGNDSNTGGSGNTGDENGSTGDTTGGDGTGTGTGTAGNDPKPATGGATQVTNTSTTNTTATATTTGGQLAETGTDAATSWTLGAAGAAVAMGAAFVAGTGRHRRRTEA
ncbi:hypothetical protein [Streptomyces sp. TRM64462]|uniref:hypothetical protein n=1 Tax=Streptomyces sp. TRM64462 TaxID=2741726 RepID=UPI001585FC0D|nr:hypothetical protein [Streptomyces sp. TRM64462]